MFYIGFILDWTYLGEQGEGCRSPLRAKKSIIRYFRSIISGHPVYGVLYNVVYYTYIRSVVVHKSGFEISGNVR